MTLSDKEYNVINRITYVCKIDWCLIKQDKKGNDYIYDLEQNKKLSLKQGLFDICDAVMFGDKQFLRTCGITEEEIDIFTSLLLKLGIIREIGDGTVIFSPEEIDLSDDINFFDELEYDCWGLFKKYLGRFGIGIINLADDYTGDDIDFYIAKQIQEKIIEILEKENIKFKFD